jgi:hypothetical protein
MLERALAVVSIEAALLTLITGRVGQLMHAMLAATQIPLHIRFTATPLKILSFPNSRPQRLQRSKKKAFKT